MIRKKILILSLVTFMLNVPIKSYSYSLNNIQLATSNSSNNPSGSVDTPQTPGGDNTNQSPSNGGNSESSDEETTPPENNAGNNTVEMDGAIGEWEPGNSDLPNFITPEGQEQLDIVNKPESGQYYTISATVPLKMEFVIKNENENGSSPNGKFVTPYYKVINNGSHTLNVHFDSFEYATSSNSRTNSSIKEELGKLYVVQNPTANNGKVEMKLNLTYDRPSNSYLKKINLIPTNSLDTNSRTISSESKIEELLGTLDSNEEGRLYYGSDLWESPKSEGIEKGVEANFNLKLVFSIDKKTSETITPEEQSPQNEQ